MKSEFEIIKKYIQPLVGDNDKYSIGLSDDVGIVDNLIFSTDTIVEGVHFLSNNKPEDIAKKLGSKLRTTIVVYKGNHEVARIVGQTDKEIIYSAIQKGI